MVRKGRSRVFRAAEGESRFFLAHLFGLVKPSGRLLRAVILREGVEGWVGKAGGVEEGAKPWEGRSLAIAA